MHRAAHRVGGKCQLTQQPVGRHTAVGIGERQPASAALEHQRRTRAPGMANIACGDLQGLDPVTAGDGFAGVAAVVEHHHHLNLFT
ncbi:hypothetical protein D9M73_298100 [compost metagenome]